MNAEELEIAIDRHSLADLLNAIETVCFEKANHLRENWQDNAQAKLWERAGQKCGNCAASIAVQNVSQ